MSEIRKYIQKGNKSIPIPAFQSLKVLEESMSFLPKDESIIICSYPKTGTTLMRYIVLQIVRKKIFTPSFQDLTTKYFPFIQVTGIEPINMQEPPYLFKVHLPYDTLNINSNAKYIYTVRNPMDVVVSYYHFQKNLPYYENEIQFDTYFDEFLEGKTAHGSYFDHVLEIYKRRHEPHLLIVHYEDLLRNKKEQILRIAQFLGSEYYRYLLESDGFLQDILRVTDFQYMKENIKVELTTDSGSLKPNIFRKGIIGDAKTMLTSDQARRLEQKMLEKMSGTTFAEIWKL